MYLIKDGDNDGRWNDATSNDIVEINDNTAGISLANNDSFGDAVALDSGMLAVGARGNDTGGANAGAVYLIASGGDDWASIESADVVVIDNTTTGISLAAADHFGTSVALDDGFLVVGANGDDTCPSGGNTNCGAVYVIDADGNDWADIVANDTVKISHSSTLGITLSSGDQFGVAVAFHDGILAVGTPSDDTGGSSRGAVYILNDKNGDQDWADTGENTKLSTSTNGITLANSDYFGSALAFDADGATPLLAVGAWGDDTGGTNRGAVYLIDSGADDWASVAATDVKKVDSTTPGLTIANNDSFGSAVALYDGALVVGADTDDTCPNGSDTDCGAVYHFDAAFEATLATGDFEKDSTPTDGDSKLAEGTITVSATPTDLAGNVGTVATGTFVYDQALPTLSSGYYSNTTISLTMSEAVYGLADADNFTIINDSGGTPANVTPTDITLAATEATKAATITLTVPETTWTGTVKVYYTQDTDSVKRVGDPAGNVFASITSANAITLSEAAVMASFDPVDGGHFTSLTEDMAISFTRAVYSDSTCTTALTSTTAGNITALKENDNNGSAIAHTTTYDATDHTITLNPSYDLAEGDVVYATLSNGWYHSTGGSCTQGVAATATVTADATAPTVVTGSTGYYSDSALSSALTGSIAIGTDVYTKYTFSEEVRETVADDERARPELFAVVELPAHAYVGSASDITLDGANTNAQGVVATSSGIYVVNDGSGVTDKVFAYNLDGTRKSGSDFALTGDYTNKTGITFTNSKFYLVDTSYVDVYSTAGIRDASAGFSGNNASESGIATDGTKLYYSRNDLSRIITTTLTGGSDTLISIADNNTNASGIAYHNGYLYIVDSSDDKVYVYNTSGTHQSALDFNLTVANSDPTGIVALANGDLLVADSADNKLYRYGRRHTTQYDIISSPVRRQAGDCVESGTGSDDGKIYTCRYTTIAG